MTVITFNNKAHKRDIFSPPGVWMPARAYNPLELWILSKTHQQPPPRMNVLPTIKLKK